jgi:hypothetical protein
VALRLSTARRNAVTDSVVDAIDAGAGAGYVEIRTGAQPSGPDVAATGTILASIALSDPAFGASSNGTASADLTPPLTDPSANATGTAGWFRVYDSNNVAVFDGAVGLEMTLNTTAVVSGQPVTITAWSFTTPG